MVTTELTTSTSTFARPAPRPAPGEARLPLPRWTVPLAAAIAAALGGAAVVLAPGTMLKLLLAALVVGVMVLRIEWAMLAYVAIEPFGDLANLVVPGAVKFAGALLFCAWAARLLIDRRPVLLRRRGLIAAGALLVVLLASTALSGAMAPDTVEVAMRYVSYLGVLLVIVDTVDTGEQSSTVARIRRLMAVFTLSCAAAAVVGVTGLLREGGRAGGPLEDPNDLAFFLIAAVPFALLLARGSRRDRILYGAAAVVLILGTCATFSRGALLALGPILVLALALRLVRPRTVVIGLVVAGVVGGIIALAASDVIARSLEEKQHVAEANIDSRFASWTIAAELTAQRPVFGHGPGAFREKALDNLPAGVANTAHLDVAHQMYLDVSSELGLLGLAAFGGVIAAGALGAIRAARGAGEPRLLGAAVAASLAGVLTAACFLSEQYYLPVWMIAALGIALDPTPARPSPIRPAPTWRSN